MTLEEYQSLLERVVAHWVREWRRDSSEENQDKTLINIMYFEMNGLCRALRLTDPEKYAGVSFIDGWQNDKAPIPPGTPELEDLYLEL